MNNNSPQKKGSAGGKATAIIQKQQALQRIDDYNKNPHRCLYCDSPIFAPYDKKLCETTIKKFCSLSCSAKYNNKGISRNSKSLSLINKFTDDEIMTIFSQSSSLADFGRRIGYKNKISWNNKSVIKKLEELNLDINSFKKIKPLFEMTKGMLFKMSSNWQSARSQIQKTARLTYENSSKCKSCIVCGYDKHYEVAHIKAVSDFNDDALILEINNLDNLIALCPNHHWEYDNANLDISKYIIN